MCNIEDIKKEIEFWEGIRDNAQNEIKKISTNLSFKRSQNGEDSVEVQDIDKILSSAVSIYENAKDKINDLNKLLDDCECGAVRKTRLGRWGYGY